MISRHNSGECPSSSSSSPRTPSFLPSLATHVSVLHFVFAPFLDAWLDRDPKPLPSTGDVPRPRQLFTCCAAGLFYTLSSPSRCFPAIRPSNPPCPSVTAEGSIFLLYGKVLPDTTTSSLNSSEEGERSQVSSPSSQPGSSPPSSQSPSLDPGETCPGTGDMYRFDLATRIWTEIPVQPQGQHQANSYP